MYISDFYFCNFSAGSIIEIHLITYCSILCLSFSDILCMWSNRQDSWSGRVRKMFLYPQVCNTRRLLEPKTEYKVQYLPQIHSCYIFNCIISIKGHCSKSLKPRILRKLFYSKIPTFRHSDILSAVNIKWTMWFLKTNWVFVYITTVCVYIGAFPFTTYNF